MYSKTYSKKITARKSLIETISAAAAIAVAFSIKKHTNLELPTEVYYTLSIPIIAGTFKALRSIVKHKIGIDIFK